MARYLEFTLSICFVPDMEVSSEWPLHGSASFHKLKHTVKTFILFWQQ